MYKINYISLNQLLQPLDQGPSVLANAFYSLSRNNGGTFLRFLGSTELERKTKTTNVIGVPVPIVF